MRRRELKVAVYKFPSHSSTYTLTDQPLLISCYNNNGIKNMPKHCWTSYTLVRKEEDLTTDFEMLKKMAKLYPRQSLDIFTRTFSHRSSVAFLYTMVTQKVANVLDPRPRS